MAPWFIDGSRSGKRHGGPFKDYKECEAAQTIWNTHARANNTEPVNKRFEQED